MPTSKVQTGSTPFPAPSNGTSENGRNPLSSSKRGQPGITRRSLRQLLFPKKRKSLSQKLRRQRLPTTPKKTRTTSSTLMTRLLHPKAMMRKRTMMMTSPRWLDCPHPTSCHPVTSSVRLRVVLHPRTDTRAQNPSLPLSRPDISSPTLPKSSSMHPPPGPVPPLNHLLHHRGISSPLLPYLPLSISKIRNSRC